MNRKITVGTLAVWIICTMTLGGCGQSGKEETDDVNMEAEESVQGYQSESEESERRETQSSTMESIGSDLELAVTFGDSGDAFTMHLYDNNETAAAIAGYVGTSGWRLPIYEYDDAVNYDVMQYYDIPDRYEIPSNPQEITSVKAGEAYYSDPNRIILFYEDAEISGEYTLIGYFDATEEFKAAVRENPMQEGWGNKIIRIEQP